MKAGLRGGWLLMFALVLGSVSYCCGNLTGEPQDSQPASNDTGANSDAGMRDTASGGDSSAAAGTPRSIFYLGHSLIGTWMPSMIQGLAASQNVQQTFQYQIGIGANLQFQRDDSGRPQGVIAKNVLPMTAFDALIMTEAVPLQSQLQFADTIGNANQYVNEARRGNPNIQIYIYEVWDHRTSTVAAWRTQIAADKTRWNNIVDTLNQRAPGNRRLLLIPGGTAFSMLSERIEAGQVPGINNLQQLFNDDVHPNQVGFYFVACVLYATLTRQSPVGLTGTLTGPGGQGAGGTYTPPPASAVPVLQQIAWDAVRNDSRSGI